MPRPWKIREYSGLNREQRALQDEGFHIARIRYLEALDEDVRTDVHVGYALESLHVLDRQKGRPVPGFDSIRSWLVLNKRRVNWKMFTI